MRWCSGISVPEGKISLWADFRREHRSLALRSPAEAAQPADPDAQSIVVTGERYRINTLNSRLPDVRDAPQSISIVSPSRTRAMDETLRSTVGRDAEVPRSSRDNDMARSI